MGHTDLYVLSSKLFHVLGCLLLVIAAYRDIVIPLNLYLNIFICLYFRKVNSK